MKGEQGQVTLFGLGMVLVLLFVFGVSTDLWRLLSTRQALVSAADAAAAAGANGLAVDAYRASGQLALDPERAEALAWDSLEDQRVVVDDASLSASSETIEVTLGVAVDLVLLDVLAPAEPIRVEAQAEAGPSRGEAPTGFTPRSE